MKIFELDQSRAAKVANDAVGGALIARSIQTAVKRFMVNKGADTLRKRLAGQALPGIALVIGLVSAYYRYKERPEDYIGMGLDIASGVAGLTTSLVMIPIQLARDAYGDVIKDIKDAIAANNGETTKPELLKLSGIIERDTIAYPAVVGELLVSIAASIREQIQLSLNTVTEWEKQIERNRADQKRADSISPEAGQAQAARAAATDRMSRAVRRTPPQ